MSSFLGTALGIDPRAFDRGRKRSALRGINRNTYNRDNDLHRLKAEQNPELLSISSPISSPVPIPVDGRGSRLNASDAQAAIKALMNEQGASDGTSRPPPLVPGLLPTQPPVGFSNPKTKITLSKGARKFYASKGFLNTFAKYPEVLRVIQEEGLENFAQANIKGGKIPIPKAVNKKVAPKESFSDVYDFLINTSPEFRRLYSGARGMRDKAEAKDSAKALGKSGLQLQSQPQSIEKISKPVVYTKEWPKANIDTQRKLEERGNLVNKVSIYEQYADIELRFGGDPTGFAGLAEAFRAQLAVVDKELAYLQAMQGINDIDIGNTARISKILSMNYGVKIQVVPRTDGKYNITASGVTYQEGISKKELKHNLSLKFNSEYKKLIQERESAEFAHRNELTQIIAEGKVKAEGNVNNIGQHGGLTTIGGLNYYIPPPDSDTRVDQNGNPVRDIDIQALNPNLGKSLSEDYINSLNQK